MSAHHGFCLSWRLQEAKRLLEQRLPIPAYDHLLKLSHVFNVLDARGAVGVTERQACFATLRALARQVTGVFHHPLPDSFAGHVWCTLHCATHSSCTCM